MSTARSGTSLQPVFIALQANNDTLPIVEAIQADNPHAVVSEYPAMVKIRRASIEERIGRDFDLRELQLNLISLSGGIDETDDEFILQWKAA